MANKIFGFHNRKTYSYEGNIRTRGGLMYYEYDGLGNVMDVTDRLGNRVMAYRYDAFGNLFTQMAAPYNSVGYTGKTYDAAAMDYSARWYSPHTGRFTTPDTYMGQLSQPQTAAKNKEFPTLTLSELKTVSKLSLVDIEDHTEHHYDLSKLSTPAQ